jgi:hypothetical protein
MSHHLGLDLVLVEAKLGKVTRKLDHMGLELIPSQCFEGLNAYISTH